MTEGTTQTADKKTKPAAETKANRLEPFTVEFGDNNCRNFTLSVFRQGNIRGAWSVQQLHDRETGGRDLGPAMTGMPAIPGIRLRVKPSEMKAYLEDPLADQPELVDRINRVARGAPSIKARSADWKPVPTRTFTLTPDTLKTLILELLRKQEAKQIRMIKGKLPSEQTIDRLEGRQLNDPWNSARKPRYADEVPAWREKLENGRN